VAAMRTIEKLAQSAADCGTGQVYSALARDQQKRVVSSSQPNSAIQQPSGKTLL
jgi:hypothetical protein